MKDFESEEKDYTVYGNYRIVKIEDKYGIQTLDCKIVIEPVFDSIIWLEDFNLIEFRLNNKTAIYKFDEISKLSI